MKNQLNTMETMYYEKKDVLRTALDLTLTPRQLHGLKQHIQRIHDTLPLYVTNGLTYHELKTAIEELHNERKER